MCRTEKKCAVVLGTELENQEKCVKSAKCAHSESAKNSEDAEEGTNSNQGEVAASAEDLEQPRTQTPAMDNLSEWRRRRMQLRRERRRSGLESLAQNISRIRRSRSRRSRIPLVDMDE